MPDEKRVPGVVRSENRSGRVVASNRGSVRMFLACGAGRQVS